MKQKSFSQFLCIMVLLALSFGAALPAYAATPVANPDAYNTPENTPLNVSSTANGVLANDTDSDPTHTITVNNFSQPPVGTGTVAVNANGTFLYTPPANFSGVTTFTYTATDGIFPSSAPATVTITVQATGANNAPVITAPASASTPPSTALIFTSISAADIDAGGPADSLTVTVTLGGTFGTSSLLHDSGCTTDTNASPSILSFSGNLACINDALNGMQFTPDPTLLPGASLTMTVNVNDNGDNGTPPTPQSDNEVVTIFIAGVIVNALGGVVVEEGNPATDTYQISLASAPASDVIITITPDAQCTATPTLTFTNANGTNPLTVTVASAQDGVLEGDHDCVITHVASGDAAYAGIFIDDLTATVLDDESDLVIDAVGGVSVAEGNMTPDTYTVRLGSNPGAAVGNVTVAITADAQCTVNTMAAINLIFTSANWFTPQNVDVVAVDDGAVESNPHNCVIGHNVSVATPPSPYQGISESLTATVADNDNVAIVLAHIGGVDTAVQEGGFTDNYSVRLGSQPTGDVTVNIGPDAQCTVSLPSLTFTTGNWFTPQPITVTAVDDPTPEADPHPCNITHTGASAVDTNYDTFVGPTLAVSVFDNDGGLPPGVTIGGTPVDIAEGGAPDTYTIALNTQPTANVLIIITPDADCTVSGNLTFMPGSGTTPQTVTVTAFDDTINEGAHTCTITHTASSADGAYNGIAIANVVANVTDNDGGGGNTPPVANNDAYNATQDTTLNVGTPGVLINDTDADGDPLTVLSNTPASSGSVTVNANGSFSFVPAGGFTGVVTFTYIATDGTDPSNSATVTITVGATPVNNPPVAVNDSYTTPQDQILNIAASGVLGNDFDADGDLLTVNTGGTTTPSTGSVTLNADGSFSYTPQSGFTGTATFTYLATDGTDDSAPATVTITITAVVNNPPVAVNDNYTTPQDTPLVVAAPGVLSNDTDADGDLLTVNTGGTTTPTTGTVTLNADGSFTYTPQAGFTGTATFTYLATDGTDDSAPATVTIGVNPAGNVAPVAVADAYTATELVPLIIAAPGVLSNDTDANGNTLQAQLVTNVTNGTLTLNANGSFTYTSNAGATTDSFTYNAFDGFLTSAASATVTITITPTGGNTAPVVTVAGVTTSVSGTMVVIHVPFTDNVGDTHTATIDWGDGAGPQPAVVTALAVDGAFTYPTTGTFTITIVITDQLGASGSHTIILDVGTGVVRFPPPVALCMDQNFIADSMIRANVPDAIRHTVRCRPIVANGVYTNSPEEQAMSSANIGNLSVLQMGVLQAVDVFSPEGLVNLSGVTVCLRGSGTLLHLYGAPRTPHAVPTYPVAAFPGFTCGSLPQTGTLVLVNGSGGTSGSGGGGATQPTPIPTISDPGLLLDSFPECTAVAFGGVNVRSTPSERGALLGVLSPDTPMTLITRVGMWYVIDYQGRTGYIRMDLVAFSCSG